MWQNIKHKFQQESIVWQTALSMTAVILLLNWTGYFQVLEWGVVDRWFRLRPPETRDERLVIIEINESDITQLAQWPMSDEILARLLTQIKAQQPRVIGVDLFRDLLVEPGHAQLQKIYQSTPNLIGIDKISGETVAPPPILDENENVGFADLILDEDVRVRRSLVSVIKTDHQVRLSLGAMLALRYLEVEGITLHNARENTRESTVKLGRSVFHRFESNDGSYIRANSGGYQIISNFRGAPCLSRTKSGGREKQPCPFLMVSMTDVLESRIPPDLLHDRIVLIGATAPSLGDLFSTPYTYNASTKMTGVEVHAHLTSQIVSAALDGRSLIQTLPEPLEWMWIGFWATCSAAFGAQCLQRWWVVGLGILGTAVVAVSSTYVAFLWGWWLPGFMPLLAIVASAIVSITYVLVINLQRSYQQLEEYAQTLELKVQERTEKLHQSEVALKAANQELQRLVSLDSLTQIANRRRFDEYLIQEWQRGLREQMPLSLILCDVDYFKQYNDTYGHQAGDRCLYSIAQALTKAVKRPTDLVARYGGEEFAIVLPNTTLLGARQVAQLIQQEVCQLSIPHRSSLVSQFVTLSLGVASQIPDTKTSLERLLLVTDQLLYQAKQQGRNTYSVDEISVV